MTPPRMRCAADFMQEKINKKASLQTQRRGEKRSVREERTEKTFAETRDVDDDNTRPLICAHDAGILNGNIITKDLTSHEAKENH